MYVGSRPHTSNLSILSGLDLVEKIETELDKLGRLGALSHNVNNAFLFPFSYSSRRFFGSEWGVGSTYLEAGVLVGLGRLFLLLFGPGGELLGSALGHLGGINLLRRHGGQTRTGASESRGEKAVGVLWQDRTVDS